MTNTNLKPYDLLNELIVTVQHQVTRFPPGSSQHTLQVNRLKALQVALAIKQNEPVSLAELKAAIAPLTSLISKSEKALSKLDPKSWQAQRLETTLSVLGPLKDQILNRLEQTPETAHD